MLETSSDDLFLPSYQDEELVDNLLSGVESDADCGGSSLSLAKAFLPLENSSSPLVPSVWSTRYKTELCTSYSSSGNCKYAEHCQFAHGLQDLRVPYQHPKYKTELCRNYHTTGYCYYGLRCLFVHNASEQRPTIRHRRNVPCRNLRIFGVCPFGTRCVFLHVESKDSDSGRGSPDIKNQSPDSKPQAKDNKPSKTLCRTFSTFGFCVYGTRCLYQHNIPNKVTRQSKHGSQDGLRLLSSSSQGSSTCSSPPSASPLLTPLEAPSHDAFSFSSQHLNQLLLPLALHLQQLGSSKAQEAWENRAV
ncbi:cysteine three histidine 1 [Gouania willdenowi]|uniref:cysteine three histidine 1 n=1 Tax=Gouania willdenowi TaxID=441366 RepID=UPI0010567982|nr:mRNA decay activator protein ZFP36L2-B-like [Gouania willdenowi]